MIDVLRYCGNCDYWYCYKENEFEKFGAIAQGECRKYPPSIPVIEMNEDEVCFTDLYVSLNNNGSLLLTHPLTFAEDWCGEFKPMKNPRWTEESEG